MTRVIHTGDTHLGYQQYHVAERREDFLAAFEQVAEDAVGGDVDAVVHAGDLFHDRRPSLTDVMGALSVLRTLERAGVPFLAIVGNHEAKRSAQWLDLYESLGLATRLGREPVTIGETAFYGLDFVPRSERDALEYEFASHDADFAALVAHGLFTPFPHGDWDSTTVLEQASVRFDAVLLGDDHDPAIKQVEEPHQTWLTYCGSTERASAAERAERGYNIVEFEPATGIDIRRRGLDTRRFVYVDVDLGPGEGVARVREQVAQHDLADVVVVVTITGDGEPVAPAAIEEAAADAGALVTRVTDRRAVGEEAEAVEVSFADPDAAVRERIRELGLSPVAQDIDETVRASAVPDSTVDDHVEDRVRERLDDGDSAAFEPAEPPEAHEEEPLQSAMEGAADAQPTSPAATDDTAADGSGAAESPPSEGSAAGPPAERATVATDRPAGGAGPAEPDDADEAAPDDASEDDQASFEEFR